MTKYKQCSSCGKFFEVNDSNKNSLYCSPGCNKLFVRCSVCGNYYEKIDPNDSSEQIVCSDECAKKYKFSRLSRQINDEI